MPKASPKNASQTPRDRYHHGDLANALLDAALATLAERRHAEFSLSDLARSVGVTPAAVYKHFADKAALMRAMVQAGFAQLSAAFERAAPAGSLCESRAQAIKRFTRLAQAYCDFGAESPALFQLMFGEAGAPFRRQFERGEGSSPSFAYLERALADLARFDVIAKPVTAEKLWFAWCAVHGATHLGLANVADSMTPKNPGRRLAALIVSALRA